MPKGQRDLIQVSVGFDRLDRYARTSVATATRELMCAVPDKTEPT
jgi:hypothetical protein